MGKEYKRVIIIGSPGSGKSTLAKELAGSIKLPLIHLDSLYWNPGWIPTPSKQFRELLEKKLEEEKWIMDGNFSSTLSLRAKRADLIIFLDFPKLLCTYRIVKRVWLYKGETRPDMGEDCPEKLDKDFLKFVWNFPRDVGPVIQNILKEEAFHADIYVLHQPKEVKRFLEAAPLFHQSGLLSL